MLFCPTTSDPAGDRMIAFAAEPCTIVGAAVCVVTSRKRSARDRRNAAVRSTVVQCD
jgi:hypothetical protein